MLYIFIRRTGTNSYIAQLGINCKIRCRLFFLFVFEVSLKTNLFYEIELLVLKTNANSFLKRFNNYYIEIILPLRKFDIEIILYGTIFPIYPSPLSCNSNSLIASQKLFVLLFWSVISDRSGFRKLDFGSAMVGSCT